MKLGFACINIIADAVDNQPDNLYLTLEQLATQPPSLRMMRVGSDLLPLYTVPEATPVYQELMGELVPLFLRCGELACANDILNDWALSFNEFDIMCEVKMKNLARDTLWQRANR